MLLCEGNVVGFLELADRYNAHSLQQYCFSWLVSNFENFFKHQHWQSPYLQRRAHFLEDLTAAAETEIKFGAEVNTSG
jgi:hypothetical protein